MSAWVLDMAEWAGSDWLAEATNRATVERERARRWRQANPERKRETNKRWRHANPEKDCRYSAEWRKRNREQHLDRNKRTAAAWRVKNPDKVKAFSRKNRLRLYGLTKEDFDRMLASQGGVCDVCKETAKRWCVDHNHTTGKVRSILCDRCNISIGIMQEDPDRLRAAADYLERHEQEQPREVA